MLTLFFVTLSILVFVELLKGLSANGTPPILQKLSWQMDLAWVMWSNIRAARGILAVALVAIWFAAPADDRSTMIIGAIPLLALWGLIYWVFNHYWVGRVKFLPITQKVFKGAADNAVDPALQVLGIDLNGEQKAFPVNMIFYHHQITDAVGGHPVWVTYCGLCRSGRVYDLKIDGGPRDFTLVGAINFNATFRDNQTGTWWRQETGEAAKGPLQGQQLGDIAFEQMSLENWLTKYPQSTVLQYDPVFAGRYQFLAKLLNYEASLPGWHRQETPPLVIGVEAGGQARAYDWEQVKKRRLVNDTLGAVPLLVLSDTGGSSAFVYDRRLDGQTLEFSRTDQGLTDTATGSIWDDFGRCTAGKLKGKQLAQVQSYRQFLRAWITFHDGTDFYAF